MISTGTALKLFIIFTVRRVLQITGVTALYPSTGDFILCLLELVKPMKTGKRTYMTDIVDWDGKHQHKQNKNMWP